MSEIPEDVMDAAMMAMRNPEGGAKMCIARAIMAERERCAKIATDQKPKINEASQTAHEVAWARACQRIAERIRGQ